MGKAEYHYFNFTLFIFYSISVTKIFSDLLSLILLFIYLFYQNISVTVSI